MQVEERKTDELRKPNNKNLFALMKGFIMVGLLILIWDMYYTTWGFSQKMERNLPGQGDYVEELEVASKYYTGTYEVEVKEQQLSKEEVEKLFEKARKEIDKSFLGGNTDLEHVTENLIVRTTYQDGLVRAKWSFDPYEYVSSEGELQHKSIKRATMVEATVELQYKEYKTIYIFSFRVIPASKKSQQGFFNEVSQLLEKTNIEKKIIDLPQSVNGQKVKWKRQRSFRGLAVMVLGVLGYRMLPMGEEWEKRRKEKRRQEEMLRDYPYILSQLSLLLSVGISLPEAADKIATRYQEKKQREGMMRPGFELLAVMNRELKDGVGMMQALEHFGRNSGKKEYRKLGLLLQQNIKKGNAHVVEMMEKENIEAFEIRKALAKKAGEEASTKLLLPMMGMLGMVVVVLIVPALLRF